MCSQASATATLHAPDWKENNQKWQAITHLPSGRQASRQSSTPSAGDRVKFEHFMTTTDLFGQLFGRGSCFGVARKWLMALLVHSTTTRQNVANKCAIIDRRLPSIAHSYSYISKREGLDPPSAPPATHSHFAQPTNQTGKTPPIMWWGNGTIILPGHYSDVYRKLQGVDKEPKSFQRAIQPSPKFPAISDQLYEGDYCLLLGNLCITHDLLIFLQLLVAEVFCLSLTLQNFHNQPKYLQFFPGS